MRFLLSPCEFIKLVVEQKLDDSKSTSVLLCKRPKTSTLNRSGLCTYRLAQFEGKETHGISATGSWISRTHNCCVCAGVHCHPIYWTSILTFRFSCWGHQPGSRRRKSKQLGVLSLHLPSAKFVLICIHTKGWVVRRVVPLPTVK